MNTAWRALAKMLPALLAAASLGCEPQVFQNLQRPPDDSKWVIYLARGACFGTCPIYSLTIRSDRRIEYEGFSDVRTRGQRIWTLRQDQMDELRALFANDSLSRGAGLFDCRWTTDMPSMFVGYRENGTSRLVEHYLGCGTDEAIALTVLEDRIDDITGVDLIAGFRGYRGEWGR